MALVRAVLLISAVAPFVAIAHAAYNNQNAPRLSAFIAQSPRRVNEGRGALSLSSCARNGDASVDRRAILASFAFGMIGVVPSMANAQLSAKEQEEYAKLLEQVPAVKYVVHLNYVRPFTR